MAQEGPPPTFSPDGHWWWDGAGWQPAVSPDRRWRWDGRAWIAMGDTRPASGLSTGALVAIIASASVGPRGRIDHGLCRLQPRQRQPIVGRLLPDRDWIPYVRLRTGGLHPVRPARAHAGALPRIAADLQSRPGCGHPHQPWPRRELPVLAAHAHGRDGDHPRRVAG